MTEVQPALFKALASLRKADKAHGDDTTFSRFVKIDPKGVVRKPKNTWLPNLQHRVLETGRSIFFRKGVKPPSAFKNLLVPGHSNVKIGRDVRKGPLRGYFIYTLSLEERATCPRTCLHWQSCYGNNMPYAKRVEHGPDMTAKLRTEIPMLLAKHPNGVLIRLHVLGDFYAPEYVAFWGEMLRRHSKLGIYGYTARRLDDPIGRAIRGVKRRFGSRFAIRWSDGGGATDCTVSIKEAREVPKSAFVCPEQTNKTKGCGTCGLCWGTTKNVAFVEH